MNAGPLLGLAVVAAAVAQLLSAAERVAVGGVLAELRPLLAVLVVQPDVVQRLAVAVGGGLRLPAGGGLWKRESVSAFRGRSFRTNGNPTRGSSTCGLTCGRDSMLCPLIFTTVSEELEVEEPTSLTIKPSEKTSFELDGPFCCRRRGRPAVYLSIRWCGQETWSACPR